MCFLLTIQLYIKIVFSFVYFMRWGSCCSCYLKELTRHERGRAILQETNLSDKDVQSPFTEKEKESISKLCKPSNQEASGWWALERSVFPIFCVLQELALLLLFSHYIMSNSLWPHWLQHARLPRPSPSPGVCSNSHPLSRWCLSIISSSVTLLSSCPQSLPASGSFPISQLFTSGGQSIGTLASASVLPVTIQGPPDIKQETQGRLRLCPWPQDLIVKCGETSGGAMGMMGIQRRAVELVANSSWVVQKCSPKASRLEKNLEALLESARWKHTQAV